MKKTKTEFVVDFLIAAMEFGGGLIDIWLNTPYKGFRMSSSPRYSGPQFRKGMQNLKTRGLVKDYEKGDVSFTEKGRVWLRGSLLRYHRRLGLSWDGKWRLVIFDIPDQKHTARNIFRAKLRTFGFLMLQKSVFAFPYRCEEELAVVARRLKVDQYINVILADSLGFQDEEGRKHFGL